MVEASFWQDKNNSQKVVKEKKFFEDLVNSLNSSVERLKDFEISNYDAEILVSEKELADFFEELVNNRDAKLVISWLTGEFFSYLNRNNLTLSSAKVPPKKLGDLIDLIADGTLSNRLAKELFEEYLISDKSAVEIVNEKGMTQLSDEDEINLMIEKVLSDNPKMLEQYMSGKEKLFGFFIGQIMKISNGKANPQMVNKLLVNKLKN